MLFLTCLLKKRWSNPFLGWGEGCPFQSRSGGTEPSVLKTFSSLKHSVSIIWKRAETAEGTAPHRGTSTGAAGTAGTLQDAALSHGEHKQGQRSILQNKGLVHTPVPTYLVLPRNGHAPCGKLLVEVIVRGLQLHAFHRGELLDVQNVLAVDGLGLKSTHRAVTPGPTAMPPTETAVDVGNPLVAVAGAAAPRRGKEPSSSGSPPGAPPSLDSTSE